MRRKKILTAIGTVSFIGSACVFQACGGDDGVKIDGGGDGTIDMPDTGTMDGNNGMDTGDMDTGVMDTGVLDSGPNCTNNPCVIGLGIGGRHACALINDGTVRCWGINARGQIGIVNDAGFNPAVRSIPGAVDGLTGITQVGASTVYTTIGVTCARTSSGGVLCLGDNQDGQLGMSSTAAITNMTPNPTPSAVMEGGLPSATSVTLNNFFVCSTTSANEYWCWGDNFGGALGRGVNPNGAAPVGKATLLGDAGAISVGSAGGDFNLALGPNGVLYSWGANFTGELGRVTMSANGDVNPAPVSGVTNVVQFSAGDATACAVTQQGQVFCWGANDYGQLGRGVTSQGTSTAAAVALPGNKNASQVSVSNYHTCALATDGSVYCWGRNNAGQIGLNGLDAGTAYNPQPVTTPQGVGLPAKAIAIGVGGYNIGGNNFGTGYSCALLDGGSVYCWGYNGDGELGRSADAGGTASCNVQSGLPNGSTCSPIPGPVVWQ